MTIDHSHASKSTQTPGGLGGTPHQANSTLSECIASFLRTDPDLEEVIYRRVRQEIFNACGITLAQIETRANLDPEQSELHPNELAELPWTQAQRRAVNGATLDLASQHLRLDTVQQILEATIKTARDVTLVDFIGREPVISSELSAQLRKFCSIDNPESSLSTADLEATRVRLARLLLSDDKAIIEAAKRFVTIPDYLKLMDRIVCSNGKIGRIGGKAAGIFIAECILKSEQAEHTGYLPIDFPFTHNMTSDVMEEFLQFNHLEGHRNHKYWNDEKLRSEYETTRDNFRNGQFPEYIKDQLRAFLLKVGEGPIIVRSSSLLEDSTAAPFSGKYDSLFLRNQGSLGERLNELCGAIGQVYACVWSPDAIAYRRELGLLDMEESMGITLQKVVGTQYGKYFLPDFAGVAMSRNDYIWARRIKRDDGFVRLVMGLGVEAVDRSGDNFTRLIPLSCPDLRPEIESRDIVRTSQHTVSVIDTSTGKLIRLELEGLLPELRESPRMKKIVSTFKLEQDLIVEGFPALSLKEPQIPLITFHGLVKKHANFGPQLSWMLKRLEECMGFPVDIEIACDGKNLFLLQNRAQALYPDSQPVKVPTNIRSSDTVFEISKENVFVPTVQLEGLSHVVYVSGRGYLALCQQQGIGAANAVAEVIRALNGTLEKGKFILVGPGRWGSKGAKGAGVPVDFAGISACALLVEIADPVSEQFSEVSNGCHFFQDLVTLNIKTLALFPSADRDQVNFDFLEQSENSLVRLAGENFAGLESAVRVIDVAKVSGGRRLHVAMNAESKQGIVYLG